MFLHINNEIRVLCLPFLCSASLQHIVMVPGLHTEENFSELYLQSWWLIMPLRLWLPAHYNCYTREESQLCKLTSLWITTQKWIIHPKTCQSKQINIRVGFKCMCTDEDLQEVTVNFPDPMNDVTPYITRHLGLITILEVLGQRFQIFKFLNFKKFCFKVRYVYCWNFNTFGHVGGILLRRDIWNIK